MGDFFSVIVDIMLLAAIPAVLITFLFRILYGSFKGKPEIGVTLRGKRVYIPVVLGSFILIIWMIYSLFHMGSVSIAFAGATVLLAAMAPVFKVYLKTTWQNTFYIGYGFTLACILGFLTVAALLASRV